MERGVISHFNGSHLCKSIVYLICYVFLVQSCIWMMPPASSRYYPAGPVSPVEKSQGILSDLADAFRWAIDLFLPAKAYAAPPVADAGGPFSIEKNQPLGSIVSLDGTASSDPDGDPLTFKWYGPFTTTSGPTPSEYIPEGVYTLSLIVNDGTANSAVNTATFTVNPCFTISARAKDGKVQLVWTHIEGTQKYDILRAEESNPFQFEKIDETTSTYSTYLDESVVNEMTYLYIVGAFLTEGTCYSNVISSHPTALRMRTPANYAPLIYSSSINNGTVGIIYNYDVNAADADTLSHSLAQSPSGMIIDPVTGLITWTPTQAGSFDVTVNVNDGKGGADSQSFTIDIEEITVPNISPVADPGGPYSSLLGQSITFDGSASYDPDNDLPLTYQWDFGDGATSWLTNPIHTYATAGDYTVTLIVTDTRGGTGQGQTTASINSPPVADAGGPYSGLAQAVITFDGSASTDPDGDPLSYIWDFGDSTPPENGVVVTHTYATADTYNVILTIDDGRGGTDTDQTTSLISPLNQPPQIISTPVTTATEGLLYSYDVNASDPDGDTLTFSLIESPSGLTIDSETGLIQWTPAQIHVGDNTVTVQVHDGRGGIDTQSFTISVANSNDPPQITSTPILTALEDSMYIYDVEAFDIDGDTLTYTLEVAPSAMTIDSANGLIEWTPDNSDIGDHTIKVKATDPFAAFDTQEYTLTVEEITDNTPPRISNIQISPLIINPGETTTITIDAVDNEAIGSYELQVDGVDIPLVGNTAIYTATTIGVHEVQATVCDTSGNCDTSIARFGVSDPGDTTAPEVSIASPETDSELTAPTDLIGTASDENLVSYTLEYSEKDKDNFVQFYKGHTEVLNDVLGTLDPSLLINGLYDIRLSAVDVNGLTNSVLITYRITGDLKVGNFTVTFKDLEIPVAGIPITIYRTYDSRIRHNMGDFGYGWNIDIRTTKVEENRELGEGWYQESSGGLFPTYYLLPDGEHYVSITLPDGQTLEFDCKFEPESQSLFPITWLNSAEYTPRPGTNGSLVALDDSPMYFDGSQILNWDFEVYNPDRYQLTTIDGTVYIIDQTEGLNKVTDNNGNSLDITPGGILHSSGKSITFSRDVQGRIFEITDPMGNVITYDYDVNGDLIAVTDQEDNTSQYTYNSNHGLVDIFDPTGNRPMRNEYDYDGRLIAHIDAEGNRIEYTHDPDSRQEIVSDRLGNITVFEYDDNGNVTKKTDPLGNETAYAYDDRGNKLSETDPLGNTTTYTYDTKDNMLTKTDPLNNTTSYTYNSRGQVLTTTDPLGYVTTNTYDTNGNLLTTIDPLGNTTTNTYDSSGNLTSNTDALGYVTNYTYDSFGNMLTQTDPLGNVTTYTYDNNGNQFTQAVTRTTPSGTETITTTNVYDSLNRIVQTIDPYGNTITTEYNPIGKQSVTIDKNGNRTEYEYDSRGNLIKTTYPDGNTETATYDAEGRKISSTDRSGRTTLYVYDALGRPTQTIYPDASLTTTTYDAAGRVAAQTDERGNTTSYSYDAAGRRISITDPLGNTTNYTYDKNGNQLTMTDAKSNTYTYQYDENNRRIRTDFPNGSFTSVTYDALGRKITETDQAGITTQFEYDALGRLIKVIDALGQETTYAYDELGNKISQTDANGNTTTWEYDNLGRVTKRALPLGMSETMNYDGAGNLLSKTDFNGNTITYTYDNNNRLIQKTYPDSSTVSFTYTPTGQRASVLDFRGLTTFIYDERDRLLQRTDPDSTVISYTYDAAGNRTSVTVPSGTTTYTFDEMNRLATVTDPDLGVTTYTYDLVGNRASVTYPNGTKAEYTYDALNRLILLENKKSDDSTISSYTYTLGPAGNRIRVQENTGRVVNYTYDALYRLTEENITDPVHGDQIIAYTYDPVGNRLIKADSVKGPTNYTYDEKDRLLNENGTSYTYDNNGNTISKTEDSDITTYSYDYENRLIRAQTPTASVNYTYDADGIRVRSNVDGIVSDYLVDKNRDYAQVLEERDAGSGLIVSYVYGDDLISMDRGGSVSFYHYDGNGNTRQLTDYSEIVTDTYIYDAFGIMLDRTGITENNYLYTGEQYDANVGFYYLRARYYSPNTGRFITVDPWEGKIWDPRSLHKYLYANVNPVNNIDPSGKTTLTEVMTVNTIISIMVQTAIVNLLPILKIIAVKVVIATATYIIVDQIFKLISQAVACSSAIIAARSIMVDAFEKFRKSSEFNRPGKHWAEFWHISPPFNTTSYSLGQYNLGSVSLTEYGGGKGGRIFQFKYGIGRNANLGMGLFVFRLDYMDYQVIPPIFNIHYHLHFDSVVDDHIEL